jgi:lipoyl(octanoyl) transferase
MFAVLELPGIDYESALAIQYRAVDRKLNSRDFPDVLMLLEHEPVITLGKRSDESELLLADDELRARDIKVVRINRGGMATYHGPGQIVGYPIVDLRRRGLKIRRHIGMLEEVLLGSCLQLGVKAHVIPGKVGLWTEEQAKIGAIGVHVTRGISFHGFSLNIELSVNPGTIVVPCGMASVEVRSVSDYLDRAPTINDGLKAVKKSFEQVYKTPLKSMTLEELFARD